MVAVFGDTDQDRYLLAVNYEEEPLHDLSSTTTVGVLHANLVGSGPIFEDEEEILGDMIAARTDEASTTTTVPPTTVPPTTSPPSTRPPSTSSATTKPKPATTTTVTQTTAPTATGQFRSDYEADFYSRINSLRGANGLPALTRDGGLDSRARSWAKTMWENGTLSHSNLNSLIPPWSTAGENVGKGGSVSSVFNALKASSGHYSVMVGGFTHIGVGVWQDPNGTLWTVQVFAG
jgi:uncharacterized protein YkwD